MRMIRVLVPKKSGAVQTTAPKISSDSVGGKKLFVFGESFQLGAVVLLDGNEQATLNDDDFSHMLKGKKAGKKIAAGSTVTLTVKNLDGTVSAPFNFTRALE